MTPDSKNRQFGTKKVNGQFDTKITKRTIWHHHSKNGHFGNPMKKCPKPFGQEFNIPPHSALEWGSWRTISILAPIFIRMGVIEDNFNFGHILHFEQYKKVQLG